jgi:hypothetical protein
MAEAPAATSANLESIYFNQLRARDRRYYELRDALAWHNHKRLVAQIDHDHLDLAAIVRIDRSRRIYQRQPVLQSAAAPRPHLTLESRRDLDRDSARNRGSLTWA